MENYEELKAKNFRFGQVGDFLKGTLLSVTQTQSPDAYGNLSMVYKVKAEEGTYLGSSKNEKTGKYSDDKENTIIGKGEEYVFFIKKNKNILVSNMKDIKIGQKFMIKFVELRPTTKGQDAHIIKVFAGKNKDGSPLMDQEWVDSQETAEGLDSFDDKPETLD